MKRKTSSKAMALEIARLALEKKAESVIVLDMTALVYYTDYFVICSAENATHAGALADNIEEFMKKKRKLAPIGAIEGRASGLWVLMDYGDLVVHIFEKETRRHYELEKLWLDAPEVPIDEAETKVALGRKNKAAVAEAGH